MKPSGYLLTLLVFSLLFVLNASADFYDIQNEIKEEVLLDQPVSPFLHKIQLEIKLPVGYELLLKAEPNILVFADDLQIGDEYYIETLTESVLIDKDLKYAETLYLYVSLYYCKSDDSQGLCIIKKILFEVPIDKNSQRDSVRLDYIISEPDEK